MLGIGLMSGTSLDGVDAALVRIEGPTHATLLDFVTRPYDAAERAELLTALSTRRQADAASFARLHVRIAEWAADAIQILLAQARTPASDLGFIAFPGQTVWHEPPTVTWQLGEPAILAERFGVRVVSNFRPRDVAAGGQGAPLVPMADVLLFAAADHPRVLLNLGGMANLTYVPRRAQEEGVFAFDTGPGVAIIDAVAGLVDRAPLLRPGRAASPRRASRTTRCSPSCWAIPSSPRRPPRAPAASGSATPTPASSTPECPGADGVATAVELTARTVADAVGRWVPGDAEVVA